MSTVRICIDVSNLDAASGFYCEALECTEVGRSAGSVRLTAGGNDLYLLLRDEGSMPFPARSRGDHSPDTGRRFTLISALRISHARPLRSPGWAETSRIASRGDWGSLTRCVDPL